jgi:hypothetical protein
MTLTSPTSGDRSVGIVRSRTQATEFSLVSIILSTTKSATTTKNTISNWLYRPVDRLCGLVVRVLGYRSGGPGSIPGTTKKKKVVGLERGSLSLLSTTEELLDRKVAAPV